MDGMVKGIIGESIMTCEAFLVCQTESEEIKVMSSPFSHYVSYRFNRDASAAGGKKGDTKLFRERERWWSFFQILLLKTSIFCISS